MQTSWHWDCHGIAPPTNLGALSRGVMIVCFVLHQMRKFAVCCGFEKLQTKEESSVRNVVVLQQKKFVRTEDIILDAFCESSSRFCISSRLFCQRHHHIFPAFAHFVCTFLDKQEQHHWHCQWKDLLEWQQQDCCQRHDLTTDDAPWQAKRKAAR